MADAEVRLDDAKARKFLKGLSKKAKQFSDKDRAVVGFLSSVVFRDIMTHFENEQGPDGRWQPWSPSYREFMSRIGKGGNKILQDRGRLRGNFKPTSVRDTRQGLLWFNNAKTSKGFPYAGAHNAGGPKLPQRQFMWISNKALDKIEKQMVRFLEK